MARLVPAGLVVIPFAFVSFLFVGNGARAAEAGAPSAEGEPDAAAAAAPAATVVDRGVRGAADVSYGLALRGRWVTVPSWMLGLFTKRNVPLSSYATAIEGFRRKGNFDFMVALGYQNMSPPDGNWLGSGHAAAVDTDYVQFKNLAIVTIDAAFVWHKMFTDWIGMHYGAGLGVGIVTGEILRTSNSGCTEANAGDVSQCHPLGVTCQNGVCSEQQLQATQNGQPDSPGTPHRFSDGNVPPAIPIINVVLGIDFRLPNVRGWEARIEGGFYDAFFLGGGVGYTF
jgi:hypothetical protein